MWILVLTGCAATRDFGSCCGLWDWARPSDVFLLSLHCRRSGSHSATCPGSGIHSYSNTTVRTNPHWRCFVALNAVLSERNSNEDVLPDNRPVRVCTCLSTGGYGGTPASESVHGNGLDPHAIVVC